MFKLSVLLIVINSAFFSDAQSPEHVFNNVIIPTIEVLQHLITSISFNVPETDPTISYISHKKGAKPSKIDVNKIDLDPTKELKVIVPGWYSDEKSCQEIVDAYVKNTDYNVILMDWRYYNNMDYMQSSLNAKYCGKKLSDFIMELNRKNRVSLDKVHIVGFSLGAHLAGFAGKETYKIMKRKINRITGLDPAGPLFGHPIFVHKEDRLHKMDAEFVDSMHTNVGVLGIGQAVGHADFFMNDGENQPGCERNESEFNIKVILDTLVCSHSRAVTLYSESIRTGGFRATSCESFDDYENGSCDSNLKVSVGDDTNGTSGKYFCKTNSAAPYAMQ